MTPVKQQGIQFTASQGRVLSKLDQHTRYSSVRYVRLGKWTDIQKDGNFYFNLPGEKGLCRVTPESIEGVYGHDFSFIGTFADSLGQVILTTHDGIVRGYFYIGNRQYELIHMGEDLYAWIKLIPNNPSCAPMHQAARQLKAQGARLAACTYNPLRVLVVYTQDAANQTPDIQGLVNQSIASFDAARGNSGIIGSVQYVRGGVITNWTENYSLDPRDGNPANNDANHFAAAIQNMRAQFNADLCIAITGNNYPIFDGIAQGIGPDSDQTFACLVQANSSINGFVFSHEIGHLMGAQHHDCNHAPNQTVNGVEFTGCVPFVSGRFEYGYHFKRNNNNAYRTIMHYPYVELVGFGNIVTYNIIYHFSNPDRQFDGLATGDASHNNARIIRENFNAVSQFRPGQGVPTAYIEGPASVYQNEVGIWEPVYSCGTGSVSFEWRISTDGGATYSGVIDTNEQLHYSFVDVASVSLWCRVIWSDGQTTNSFRATRVRDGFNRTIAEQELPAEATFSVVAPNPATDLVQVSFSIPKEQTVRFQLVGTNGVIYGVLNEGNFAAGKHTQSLRLRNPQPGLYLLQMQTGDRAVTRKLTIQP